MLKLVAVDFGCNSESSSIGDKREEFPTASSLFSLLVVAVLLGIVYFLLPLWPAGGGRGKSDVSDRNDITLQAGDTKCDSRCWKQAFGATLVHPHSLHHKFTLLFPPVEREGGKRKRE